MAAIFVLTALMALAFSEGRTSTMAAVDEKFIIEGGNGCGGGSGSGNVASLEIWRERRRPGGAMGSSSSRVASPTAMTEAMKRTRIGTTMGRRRHRGEVGSIALLAASASGGGRVNVDDDDYDDDGLRDHNDRDELRDNDDFFETPSHYRGGIDGGNERRRRGNGDVMVRNQLQPPNIKLMPQPRKRELWLPWPLDAMRSDYHRFEADEKQRRMRQRQVPGNGQDERWWQNHHRLGSESLLSWEWQDQWLRGREWATGILLRGGLASSGNARGATNSMRRFSSGMRDEYDVVDDDINETSASSSSSTKKSIGGGARDTAASIGNASWLPWGKGNYGDNDVDAKTKTNAIATGNYKSIGLGGSEGGGRGIDSRHRNDGAAFDRDVLLRYLRLQASVRLRQLGYVGSDFSVHLPPSSPVLLFYFLLPSRRDPMRRLVRYTLAGATLSWMHSECTKYRRFSPLPMIRGVNVRRPELPPFLPEEDGWMDDVMGGGNGKGGVVLETDPSAATTIIATNDNGGGKQRRGEAKGGGGATALTPPRKTSPSGKANAKSTTNQDNDEGRGGGGLGEDDDQSQSNGHHLWDPFQSFGSVSSIYRTWLEGHNIRALRSAQQRRICASEQLLTLRKTNSTAVLSSSTSILPETVNNADVGYALVTGASSGIGRALRYVR
jgi:hypothetical protein